MSQGHITANGVVLQQHEISTIVFLTQQGFDVSLIPPQRRKGAHTPDIHMLGLDWEMKRPKGQSSHTIKRAFKTASRQSSNIIFERQTTAYHNEEWKPTSPLNRNTQRRGVFQWR